MHTASSPLALLMSALLHKSIHDLQVPGTCSALHSRHFFFRDPKDLREAVPSNNVVIYNLVLKYSGLRVCIRVENESASLTVLMPLHTVVDAMATRKGKLRLANPVASSKFPHQ